MFVKVLLAGYIHLLHIYLLSHAGTFETLCITPFQFGKGELKGLECKVTYQMQTNSEAAAKDVCEALSPFDVQKSTAGFPTTCTYEKTHQCKIQEISLYDYCIVVKNRTEFSPEACGENYTLFTIQNQAEHKWISVFLHTQYFEFWTGNEKDGYLKPSSSGQVKLDTSSMRIKLRVGTAIEDVRKGKAYFELPQKKLFHLCARPAQAFMSTVNQMRETFQALGLTSGQATDHFNKSRPFTYMSLMLPVAGVAKYYPDVHRLQEACKLMPHGYVASLNDYIDNKEFESLRTMFPHGSYRTTAARNPIFYIIQKKCHRDPNQDVYKSSNYWYYDPSNVSAMILEEHWENQYPSLLCSDMPRTTIAMRRAYVDMPAFARLALICSYGNPPNLPPLRPEEQCSKRAIYKNGKCQCVDPKKDAKILDPVHYGHYPEALFCLDCGGVDNAETRAVVFIVDNTDSVPRSGWDRQKLWLKEIVDAVGNIQAGVMVLRFDSYVSINVGDSKNPDWRREFDNWVATHKWADAYDRHVGIAFRRAIEELDKVQDPKIGKYVVFISDGHSDKCWRGVLPFLWDRCKDVRTDPSGQYEIEMANKIWDKGYKLVYIMVGNYYLEDEHASKKVEQVTRGFSNLIRVARYDMIDASITEAVLNIICRNV
ncbi:unnamed protein product [Cylicocyclus nassatus]|uniref:VWFA domain-containing protein n=1 Tax=Cylicocyclus nassatus TaxID=53992 RepID=A0AA36GUU0_CYLNA|nr:unnamed protein product [Cylicocyclus nassatus]